MNFLRCVLLVSVVFATGCASFPTQITKEAPGERGAIREMAREGVDEPGLAALRAAEIQDAGPVRLANLLAAARASEPGALRGEAAAGLVYRAAVRRIVAALEESNFAPPKGLPGGWSIDVVDSGRGELDPQMADVLVPADQVRFRGLDPHVRREGFGLPMVAWFAQKSPGLAKEPGIPQNGVAQPVTAWIDFRGRAADLHLTPTWDREWVRAGGRRVALAADFSAPLALMVARGRNKRIDFRALIRTDVYVDEAGLFQYQPYDPDKIPVVLVHGLLSRPEVWVQTINQLQEDPEIRRNYQFWFFFYPSGLPIWTTAALLRKELDSFKQRLEAAGRPPHQGNMIMVGHSMGGIVTNLMIRRGGEALWSQFSDVPFAEADLPPRARKVLDKSINFEPYADIKRVVFMSAPHRGSYLASRPIGSLGAGLIRLPFPDVAKQREQILNLLRPEVRRNFSAPANSIRFLRPQSPLLLAILKLERNPVPMHSIIGDRGRGDTPNSSDGVVPYHSAHMPDAVSETIVPSNHGTNEHPEGIEALRLILREDLKARGIGPSTP